MHLGDKIRALRVRDNKTLKEQSESFRVSMNSVYRWEHNLAVPRMPILKQIAEYYDVPLEWFFHETIAENNSERGAHSLACNIEQQLVSMFRKLPDASKYMVLGYVERMCLEEYKPEAL